MSIVKIIILLVVALPLVGGGGLFLLAQQSKSGAAIGIVNGFLAACPSSPNCVSSEAGTQSTHAVDAFPASSWAGLSALVENTGGVVVSQTEDYLAAEYSTKTLGFVDDVEFRKGPDLVQVRSASRVGYSDAGANKERIEELRTAL